MSEPKKTRKSKNNLYPSLSSVEVKEHSIEEIREKVFSSINNKELEKALDNWLLESSSEKKIVNRDLNILKHQITEYLDSYIIFGYNPKGDRIIIQHVNNPKDRDALMEFFKTIFIKQQQENFLDIEDEE